MNAGSHLGFPLHLIQNPLEPLTWSRTFLFGIKIFLDTQRYVFMVIQNLDK